MEDTNVLRKLYKSREAKSMLKMCLRSLALEHGFRDFERCETVCLVLRVKLPGLVGPVVQVCNVPDVERCEVLVDSRG